MSTFQDFEDMCLVPDKKSQIHCKDVQISFAAWWAMYVSPTLPPPTVKIANKRRKNLKPDSMGRYKGVSFTPLGKDLIASGKGKFFASHHAKKSQNLRG